MDLSRIDDEFGEALRIARQASGITQEELADMMFAMGFKLSQATIGKIERGERKVTVGESQALARGLGLFGSELIRGVSGASARVLKDRLKILRDEAKDALHAYEAGQALVLVQLAGLSEMDRAPLEREVHESLEELVESYRRDREVANTARASIQEGNGVSMVPAEALEYDPRRGYEHPRANALILQSPSDG